MEQTKFASFDEARTAMNKVIAEKRNNSTPNSVEVSINNKDKYKELVVNRPKNMSVNKGFTTILNRNDISDIKVVAKCLGWTLDFDNKHKQVFVSFGKTTGKWRIEKANRGDDFSHLYAYHTISGKLIYLSATMAKVIIEQMVKAKGHGNGLTISVRT